MIFTQYKLKEVNSETYKICWLDKPVEVGSKITLKGESKWFKVMEKYNKVDSSVLDLNRNPEWYSISKYINPYGQKEVVFH